MSASTVLTMILVCGSVWGGFLALLVRAIRREGQRSREGFPPSIP
jgi:hypothetical protein